MENPIKQIYNFNDKAGLLNKGYSDTLESSFQIEEALEGFDIRGISDAIGHGIDGNTSAKVLARAIIALQPLTVELSDVARLDKAVDAVVFAVGSMAKLGLNPNEITKAINIVMAANNAKLGCPTDSEGKLMKPDNFEEKYAPEPKLQALLDEAAGRRGV